jgi:2,3-dihydroxyphenylpropionate 1,2-dioxygenase
MSEIVLGVGASHSTLMNTHWDKTVHRDRAERFRDALGAARDAIAAARPDTVVLVGSNHFRGFWLDLIPAFTIGIGECVASGESGTPKGPQRVDVPLARHIAGSLVETGRFDLAYSARLQIDHGQSHAIQYLLDGLDVAIVPVVVNVFAPPLPTLARCDALGAAIREAVLAFPADRRVAVVGSGGLSHRLPWPDWRDPHGDDEEFLVEAWLNGRDHWQDYDARRREIITAAAAAINQGFDDEFLTLLEHGAADRLTGHSTARLGELAGNGAQELRTWLVMAAALGHSPGRRLAYEPMPEWLTGMAVAVLDPSTRAQERQ